MMFDLGKLRYTCSDGGSYITIYGCLRYSLSELGRAEKRQGMKSDAHLGPGVKIPPPIIYLTALLLGLGLDYLWPTAPLPSLWGYVIGSILAITALPIVLPVLARFKKAETPFSNFRKPTTVLITDGPLKYSRNPSYVSLTLLYLGLGFAFNSGWVLGLSLPVLLIMDLWVVRREERHLEAKFGEEYLHYKSTVRRWL